jgi:hypothetical protein
MSQGGEAVQTQKIDDNIATNRGIDSAIGMGQGRTVFALDDIFDPVQAIFDLRSSSNSSVSNIL